MKKERTDLWHIYQPVDDETRIIYKSFSAKTKKEAQSVYEKTSAESGNRRLVLENRNVQWWRIYAKNKVGAGRRRGETKTLATFTAKSRDEAYARYLEYVNERGFGADGYVFYGKAWGHLTQNKDKTHTDRHGFGELLSGNRKDGYDRGYRNGFKAAKEEYSRKYEEDMPYWLKTGHSRSEWYNLGYHVMDDLLFNVPILIEKCNGYPNEFSEIAAKKLGLKNGETVSEKVSDLGFRLWKEELGNFLLQLRLYKYYSEYGIVDPKDKGMADVEKRFKDTLPIYPGTEEFDYGKLGAMIEEKWDFVVGWAKKWLRACWD